VMILGEKTFYEFSNSDQCKIYIIIIDFYFIW
jgi:hypothetical protein